MLDSLLGLVDSYFPPSVVVCTLPQKEGLYE